MGDLMNFLAQYWPVILLVVFGLIILYWLLSKFFKFTMALLVIVLAIVGYHYYNSTGTFTERIMKALEKSWTQYDRTVADGKAFFDEQKKKLNKHFNDAANQTQKDAKERDRSMTKQGEAIEDKLKLR
jgi:glucan phosphoethanolaminetransferase (alkaline phosphatase superfamily)